LTVTFGNVGKVEKKFQQIGEFDVILDPSDKVDANVAGTYKKCVFSVSTSNDTFLFNASSQLERWGFFKKCLNLCSRFIYFILFYFILFIYFNFFLLKKKKKNKMGSIV